LDILGISRDTNSGLVRISIEHYSPIIAQQWVEWLIEDLNRTVMEREVAQANQAIKYLNEQIKMTHLSELRAVFFRLIEEQTKTIMLARVTPEYLLRTVDPAIVPEIRSWPNRILIVTVAFILALFFTITIVLVFHNIRAQS